MNDQPSSVDHVPENAGDDASRVVAYTREILVPGFVELDEALEIVADFVGDDFDEDAFTPDEVEGIVRRTWDDLAKIQREWPDEGDYRKVAAAFDELESDGFVARMNFTCCQNCGHGEIRDERTGDERAYVFFHQQDAERLGFPDSELYLAFGFFPGHPAFPPALVKAAQDGDEAAQQQGREIASVVEAEIGTTVVDTLRKHGLQVEWNGKNTARPVVAVGHWRKRLPVS